MYNILEGQNYRDREQIGGARSQGWEWEESGCGIKGPHVRFCGDGDVYYLDCGSGYIILLRIKLPRTRCTQIHTYK